jgi:crotonobetainyl-CoA:carnitine CoA-transferase CaiB-like acyl-CoA transferase
MLLPLKDIRVLELANVLAGPSVGVALAELGATVIKVENFLTCGDVTRTWKLPSEDKDTDISGYFSCVNWGKKSVSIDISNEEGLNIIYSLTRVCDIILVSYKPGDAEKLKVDYKTLNKWNNRIIYAQVTGYGQNNPRAGYDAIIQAESGFTFMNGEQAGQPVKMPVALMDILAGHQLKEAILLALFTRERTGKGSYVETSLIKSGVAALANQATNWLVGNTIPGRMGSDHPNIVPYGTIYYSRDKKPVVLAIGNDKQFADMCSILGDSAIAKDERFSKNFSRVKNRIALNKIIQKLVSETDRDILIKKLDRKNVPAGGVFNMKEVFEQPEAAELLMEGITEDGKALKGMRTIAFSFDGDNSTYPLTPPPHYGEHTIKILSELLGMGVDTIEKLIEKRVVYAGNKQ